MAFLANAISVVKEGKRGLSWFSIKEPKREVSAQVDFMVLMPFSSCLMSPEVELKAEVML